MVGSERLEAPVTIRGNLFQMVLPMKIFGQEARTSALSQLEVYDFQRTIPLERICTATLRTFSIT